MEPATSASTPVGPVEPGAGVGLGGSSVEATHGPGVSKLTPAEAANPAGGTSLLDNKLVLAGIVAVVLLLIVIVAMVLL